MLALCVTAQPVHGELEYIKMRYRSPARSSFRDVTRGGVGSNSGNSSPFKQPPPPQPQQTDLRVNQGYDTISTPTPLPPLPPAVTVIHQQQAHHDFPPPPSPLTKDQPSDGVGVLFGDGDTAATTGLAAS